jgi:hypothetical protein
MREERMKNNKRPDRCGSRKRGRAALSILSAAVIMSAALLSGCSWMPSIPGLPGSKPTAVSLAKAAAENMQKTKSFSMHMDMDTDLAMTYQVLNISANAGLDIGMDMDMTRDPQLAKGNVQMQVDAVGQKESVEGEFYLDPSEGDGGTTYVRWSGGEWMKQTGAKKSAKAIAPGGKAALAGSAPAGFRGSAFAVPAKAALVSAKEAGTALVKTRGAGAAKAAASGGFPENILEGAGLLKLIAEQALDADLQEETVEVNGEEAWQINTVLRGPLLKEMLQKSGTRMPFDINDVDWDKVGIPSEIYIYRESELPARMVLDCQDLGSAIFGDMLDQITAEVPVEDIKIEISACTIDLIFTNYDGVEPFEIPQEARDAASSDSLMPGALDVLGG